jgi:hypothetical protein
MKYELIYHMHFNDLLNDEFIKSFSFNKFIKMYNEMQKVLKSHYYNLALPISRFMSLYANSKSEKEITTDYNPFSDNENQNEKITGDIDSICCSCLLSSIQSNNIPKWALDLINYDHIKFNADSLKRSSERFYITNGIVLLDAFRDKNFLYCPMGIFDYERIERQINNDCINIYSINKEYICTVKLNEDLKTSIGLFQFRKEYNSIIGNLKMDIVK